MGSDSIINGTARNGGGGGGGGVQIPASVKKVVQNLKEIVNNSCTDSEIYAVLRDCNMDPSDAVQRLLSQDTFHEVKSKRERRKEMKETQELKTRANGRASNRGVRDGSEHSFGQSGSTLSSFNELGKSAYKKENGSVVYMPYSASSKLHATGQTLNEQLFPRSNSFDADYRGQSIGTGDVIDSSMQPSYGSQSSWVGSTLEHVAMADIVRMGRAKSKDSQVSCETSYCPQDAVPRNATIHQMKPSFPTSDSKLGTDQEDLNMTSESGKKSTQHGFDNGWAVNEPMAGSHDIGGAIYSNQSYLHDNKANLSSNCWSDNILVSESNVGSPNLVNLAQASNKQKFTSDSGRTFEYDDDLRKDTNVPDSYGQIYEHLEVAGRGSNASAPNPSAPVSDDSIKAASSVAVNLQQLSLGKEEGAATPKEGNFGVVLPDYLQALSADCSHLSFGTYKSGKSIGLPQPQTSSSLANDLEETLMNSNGCSTSMHLDSRNLVYHDREQLEFDFDSHRATVNARNYDSPKTSQSECRKLDIPDAATIGNDYVSCASLPGSSFKNIERSSSLSLMIDPNARNLPVLPSDMQSHSNPMPSDILAAAIQSTKARDSAAFLTSPSISSRYIGSASSIKNPIVSMSQPSSQALHGANPTTGPVLKEHLYAHSYPQNGYPAAPQGHTYTASALRQAFPDGNVFREPHTDMKYDRQHYGSASMSSSLPWLSSYTSGYQSLENPSNSPGSSLHNLLAGSAGSKLAYENFLHSQYSNGGANFNLPQQNGGGATWDYGHGSRTISTIPENANYGLRGGQNHLLAGYQQGQQQAQQLHGSLGYPGIYGSHTAMAMEQQQQQNLRDLILNASQGQTSRQLPQTWQHKY